ncbi:putative holin [Luteibacter aegosomatis]|uniref:putative holin n=1 Tax=Luteibacter aegosomatis TaxID=2911537 RepID=UPI001FF84559|nr:putative holin [Luteibacter aegosomatis]UPG87010.1 putative holin [Luteibacter aegosomatis]
MSLMSHIRDAVTAWVAARLKSFGLTGVTRVWRWWVAALVLLAIVTVISPQAAGVLTLKFGQQMLAAIVGYHLAKITLIHAVPERLREVPIISAALTLGRALVMAGAMLAVGLGL